MGFNSGFKGLRYNPLVVVYENFNDPRSSVRVEYSFGQSCMSLAASRDLVFCFRLLRFSYRFQYSQYLQAMPCLYMK